MPSPFPGMDPYIEDTEKWPGFHAKLAGEITAQLNPRIGPKYYADVEIQSVPFGIEIDVSGPIKPDVSVFEPLDIAPEPVLATVVTAPLIAPVIRPAPASVRLYSVRIYRTRTSEVVTAIEILSPYNKRSHSMGLEQYRQKRAQLLVSRVHLVELDLLRGGERPGEELNDPPLDTDYILLVNRARYERMSEIWPVALNEPLPLIPVPLLPPDPDVTLDLNAAIREVYTRSGYEWRIQYGQAVPPPPLRPAIQAWVKQLLEKFPND